MGIVLYHLGPSLQDTSLVLEGFQRRALEVCEGLPMVYVDRAPWYRWALGRLGVPWEHRTFGPRNPIEQWFGGPEAEDQEVLQEATPQRRPGEGHRVGRVVRKLLSRQKVLNLTSTSRRQIPGAMGFLPHSVGPVHPKVTFSATSRRHRRESGVAIGLETANHSMGITASVRTPRIDRCVEAAKVVF
ncbi:MAG: hypothetical protein LN412_05575 [Candidatus Thermoplasmatota archaeon]|nr:hypothetical protein [Candidatus Thermoplasmatota archaeon]